MTLRLTLACAFALPCFLAAQTVQELQTKIDSLDKLRQYQQIIPVAQQMMDLAAKEYGIETMEYYRGLVRLANAKLNLEEFQEAEKLLLETLPLIEKLKGRNFVGYANALSNLAVIDFRLGRYASCKQRQSECIAIRRQLNRPVEQYTTFLAETECLLGNPEEAERLLRWTMDTLSAQGRQESMEYAKALSIYAARLCDYHDFAVSDSLFQVAIAACKKNDPNALAALESDYLSYKGTWGNLSDWETYYLERKSKYFSDPNATSQERVTALYDLGESYLNRGVYMAAEGNLKQALQISESTYGKQSELYAVTLDALAKCYLEQGKLELALSTANESLELKPKIFGYESRPVANCLATIGNCQTRLRHWAAAETALLEAQRIYEEVLPNYGSLQKAFTNTLLGILYYEQGLYPAALPYLEQSLRYYQAESPGQNHPFQLYTVLGNISEHLGRQPEAAANYTQAFATYTDYFFQNYHTFIEAERLEAYFNQKQHLDETASYAYRHPDALRPGLLLDQQLFLKGIVSASMRGTRERIAAARDTALNTQFAQWLEARSYWARLSAHPKPNAAATEKARRQMDALEKTLCLRSKPAAQFAQPPVVSWREVQAALRPGEAALDIARITYFDRDKTDTVLYAFHLITPGTTEKPVALFLFDDATLKSVLYEQYRAELKNTPEKQAAAAEIYRLVWKALEPHLSGIRTIFVAPDGIFHKINLATLVQPGGAWLQDKYVFRTLTNLKELLYRTDAQPPPAAKTALLLGDPAFDLNAPAQPDSSGSTERGLDNLRDLVLQPLPGSRREVNDIDKLLRKNGWQTTVLTGREATASAVKTAQSPTVLHLATHGYFWENLRNKDLPFGTGYAKEEPMLRTMLFFAGAQNTIQQKTTVAQADDGILSAFEAQNLRLDGTELVVLSACNTGAGVVRTGEGVFGLQRALKVAGAQNLLLSLWSVDDQVTQLMMSTFYAQWLSGQSKPAAFRTAQETVRAKYPQPFYWGAFFLVE